MNKNPEVDQWLANFNHPLKDVMLQVREIVLSANPKMEEDIKWSAPNFKYKGNMATFNPRAKKFVNLTFHTGAIIHDPAGLLEGDKPEARVARFDHMDDVNSKKEALAAVVNAWVSLKDEG